MSTRRLPRYSGRDSALSSAIADVEEQVDDAVLERRWREFYASVAPTRAEVRCADAMFARLVR